VGLRGGTVAVAAALVVVAGGLSGCVTDGVAAAVTADDDFCRDQRLALDQSQSFLKQDIAKNVAIGFVGGALATIVTGGGAGDALKNGIIAGATAGIATAYWNSLQKDKVSGSALYARMNGDMTQELEHVNKTQIAYNDLVRCRKQQATKIRGDFVSGKINREQANTEMAKVKSLAEQDYQIALQINSKVKTRTENFAYATTQATGKPIPKSTRAAISGTPAATEAGSLQCCSALQASNTNFEQAVTAPKAGDFTVN
jgi:hypothetical protein